MLLAALLKDADINVIFTSELERTVKTAEPLADGLGIKPKALPQLNVRFNPSDIVSFVSLLRSGTAGIPYWSLLTRITFLRC
jgi:broad specificity phosphatase PhoE